MLCEKCKSEIIEHPLNYSEWKKHCRIQDRAEGYSEEQIANFSKLRTAKEYKMYNQYHKENQNE